MSDRLDNLDKYKVQVLDAMDDIDKYDVMLGNDLVLTNVTEAQARSYIMKVERKIKSLLGQVQRELEYVDRWKRL